MKHICVDLDGTLIYSDVTILALKQYIKRSVGGVFRVLWWLLLGGRSRLKNELASSLCIDPSKLKYRESVLEYIAAEKLKGNKIYLATAADEKFALIVATYLKCFDGIFASDGHINLRAEAKAQKLISEFGEGNFVYIGNSNDDLHVWKYAEIAITVSPKLVSKMKDMNYLVLT